jgi:type I restriction enzyme S subunit
LKWLVLNELFIQAVEAHSEGLSYPAINAPVLISLKVAVPPMDEQIEISLKIEKETSRIDNLINKTQKSIDLLREHHSAFITAAVTGQIDLQGEVA